MPFIGQDWRSPGEEWVKTNEGWEKKKLLEKLARSRLIDDYRNSNENLNDNDAHCNADDGDLTFVSDNYDSCMKTVVDDRDPWQPFCPITIKCTREIAGFNGLGEAFKRLDFPNAVRDIRRFNYICKLLHLIITQNLTTLSGCAQKVLFTMLEEVASQVSVNKTNIHILQKLLSDLEKTLITYYCWGRPLGSTMLWEQHMQTITRINAIARCIQIKQPDDKLYPKLQNLPEECVREILLRLTDHKDLQSSGQAYGVMEHLLGEQRIWRELCKFHFSRQQIQHAKQVVREEDDHDTATVAVTTATTTNQQATHCHQPATTINHNTVIATDTDWQKIYHKLRRMYGLKEEYAEILLLCRICKCLFWKSFGHPCIAVELDEDIDKSTLYVPIPPQAFLKFFSL